MSAALTRFRVVAWFVGVFLLLLSVGILLRYTDLFGIPDRRGLPHRQPDPRLRLHGVPRHGHRPREPAAVAAAHDPRRPARRHRPVPVVRRRAAGRAPTSGPSRHGARSRQPLREVARPRPVRRPEGPQAPVSSRTDAPRPGEAGPPAGGVRPAHPARRGARDGPAGRGHLALGPRRAVVPARRRSRPRRAPGRAVVREVAEETGLQVLPVGVRQVLTDVIDLPHRGVQVHTVRLVYDVEVVGGALRRQRRPGRATGWASSPLPRPARSRSPPTSPGPWACRTSPWARSSRTSPHCSRCPGWRGGRAPRPARRRRRTGRGRPPAAGGGLRGGGPRRRRRPRSSCSCRLADHVSGAARWTLPGGGLDHGETVEQGLRRELHEETGLPCAAQRLLGVSSTHFTGRAPSGVAGGLPRRPRGARGRGRARVSHGSSRWAGRRPRPGGCRHRDLAAMPVTSLVRDALAMLAPRGRSYPSGVTTSTGAGPRAQFTGETSTRGEWKRQANHFTGRISRDSTSAPGDGPDAEGRWPVEAGRYRLVVCLACPWAHRSLLVRGLLGLQDAISLAVVDPIRDEAGWRFWLDERPPRPGARHRAPLGGLPRHRPRVRGTGDRPVHRRHPDRPRGHQRLPPDHARPVDRVGRAPPAGGAGAVAGGPAGRPCSR